MPREPREREVRADEGIFQALRVTDLEGSSLASGRISEGACSASGVIEIPETRGRDRGVGHLAIPKHRDAGTEEGVGTGEVGCSIHRVKQPGAPGLCDLTSALFREDGVLGVAFPDARDHQVFAEKINLGNEVFGGFLPDFTWTVVAGEL
jgi:hypothetical protein